MIFSWYFSGAVVSHVAVSLFRPIMSIPLALTGVFSRLGDNVSAYWHLTIKVGNGCLSLYLLNCILDHPPSPDTYYLPTLTTCRLIQITKDATTLPYSGFDQLGSP